MSSMILILRQLSRKESHLAAQVRALGDAPPVFTIIHRLVRVHGCCSTAAGHVRSMLPRYATCCEDSHYYSDNFKPPQRTSQMAHTTSRSAVPSSQVLYLARTVPDFLAPSFVRSTPSPATSAKFSTSASKSYPRDRNPNRGVSALRRTGLRQPVSISKEPLPQPVLDPSKRSKVAVDETHGLWGFFNSDKAALATPEQEASHGTWQGTSRLHRD